MKGFGNDRHLETLMVDSNGAPMISENFVISANTFHSFGSVECYNHISVIYYPIMMIHHILKADAIPYRFREIAISQYLMLSGSKIDVNSKQEI